MPVKESLIARLGFTPARRRALLGLIGLEKADHAHAAWLQKNVIAPHIDQIIDEFHRRLWKHPQAENILKQGYELSHLRATQRAYLLTLGMGFDRAAYFEGRLRVGVAHARIPVPLSLYQAACSLLQCLILARLSASVAKTPARYRALAAYLIKITALDMSLAIETYHDARMGVLRKSISALRGKTLDLHRRMDTDTFTGLVNHARILTILKHEIAKAGGHPVSVIIADVDVFKSINDTYGHLIGDKVLQGITGRLRSAARRGDVVGRYGGDEFLIVLKDTPARTARTIAERMRARVGDEPLDLGGHAVRVTLSAGVATARATDDSEGLIARADAALYRAKRAGRNRVMTAGGRIQSRPRAAAHD